MSVENNEESNQNKDESKRENYIWGPDIELDTSVVTLKNNEVLNSSFNSLFKNQVVPTTTTEAPIHETSTPAPNEIIAPEFIRNFLQTHNLKPTNITVANLADLGSIYVMDTKYLALVDIIPYLSRISVQAVIETMVKIRPDIHILANIDFADRPDQSYKQEDDPNGPIKHNLSAIRSICKSVNKTLTIYESSHNGAKWCSIA